MANSRRSDNLKAVGRRLLNLAAAVSIGLCVATCALWWRSYWFYDRVVYASEPGHSGSQLHLGGESILDTIAIGYVNFRPASPQAGPPPFAPGLVRSVWKVPPGMPNETRHFADLNGHQFAGFGAFAWSLSRPYTNAGHPVYNYGLLVPHWAVAAVTAAIAWLCYRKRRVVAAGICSGCGYDLRATPNRCPECGRVPEGISR